MINFEKSYFYDEVKEGFYISSMMKCVRAAELEVLDNIARVCRLHNIQWFADCGTLLGAVRHGGYIPWDDDLDICMLRDDYQRFHKYAVKDLPKEYVIRDYENDGNWQIKTHVVNRQLMSVEAEELEKYHGCPFRVGVDIFVLDYIALDPQEEEVRRNLIDAVLSIADQGDDDENFTEEMLDLLTMVEETCRVKLDRSHHLRQQIYGLAEKLACLYPSAGAKEVALMPFWASDGSHKYPVEAVNRITQLPFENIMINVPAAYDEVLRIEYGEYLRICREGGLHDYPIYQNQLENLVRQAEIEDLFQYKYNPKDLEKERDSKPISLKQKALQYCEVLGRMHVLLEKMLLQNETDGMINILEECQQGVIRIGNEIESQEGEGTATVRCFEEYCERLYETALSLENGEKDNTKECMTALTVELEKMRSSIDQDMKSKKEIVFLVFRPDYWKSMQEFYNEECKNEENIVYVIPIPFYDRDFIGNVGEMHYDLKGYPENVGLLDFSLYNIKEHHPEKIYTQYAYDWYNCTYTVAPEYYTEELKKHTEQLIYVPYFKIGEFSFRDEKLRKTTDYFVKIPGLMHADKVFVESKEMKKLYLQELIAFCGEETKDIWDKKILVMNYDVCTNDNASVEIPEKWSKIIYRENGEKKKTVLYQITVSSLYQYKDKMLLKLSKVLELFWQLREEVTLIFRPQLSFTEPGELFEESLWSDYKRVLQEYQEGEWGVLDEADDMQIAAAIADAYYGDPGYVMQQCRLAGKPVMIQNVEI